MLEWNAAQKQFRMKAGGYLERTHVQNSCSFFCQFGLFLGQITQTNTISVHARTLALGIGLQTYIHCKNLPALRYSRTKHMRSKCLKETSTESTVQSLNLFLE